MPKCFPSNGDASSLPTARSPCGHCSSIRGVLLPAWLSPAGIVLTRGLREPSVIYPTVLLSSLIAYSLISQSAAWEKQPRDFFFVWEKKNCHKFMYLKDFSPEKSPLRLPFSGSESLA